MTARKLHCKADVAKALACCADAALSVDHLAAIRDASVRFGIPERTLRRRLEPRDAATSASALSSKKRRRGPKPLLSLELETQLAGWIRAAAVVEYYQQRATDGGLLISEATNISPQGRGYFGAPGLFAKEQVEAWKSVTEAVHDKGGKIFVQLWHTGRVGHPLNQLNGQLPVSSSNVSMEGVSGYAVTSQGRKNYMTPRALDISEIPGIVADSKLAVENAIAAGFDGVEIHAANGYLLEEFLCDGVNTRTDAYGGSIANRARFLFEVVEAVVSALPSSQVGIRLSPFGHTFGCKDSTPTETYGYVAKKLNDYDLAYLHVVERRGMHSDNSEAPEGGVARHFRSIYRGGSSDCVIDHARGRVGLTVTVGFCIRQTPIRNF